jgi:acyl carrier protein
MNGMMSYEELKQLIVDVLCIEPDEVTLDALFQEDLNAEPEDLAQLFAEVETRTGLEIDTKQARKIKRVRDLWNFIQEEQELAL